MDLSGGNGSDYKVEHAELKKSLKIMSITINILVFVLGVLGNGVVIWVTVTGFKMKKNANSVWYLNLAVADFLFTAFLPLTITETALDEHWPFGKFMCTVHFLVLSINMYASVYILMAISVDRCVCVVWPVWPQKHRSVRKVSCVSLGVWVLALVFSSPYFIFIDTQHDKDIILCLPNYAPTDEYRGLAAMVFTQFFMGFVVPFTVIVSCYSVIIYRFRGKRLRLHRSDGFFKTIVAVIAAFFLCWAPFHIMEQIVLWGKFVAAEHSEALDRLIIVGVPIATSLAFLNSCLNPLLYVFIGSRNFKAEFRRSVQNALVFEELSQANTQTTKEGITGQSTALSDTQEGVSLVGPSPQNPEVGLRRNQHAGRLETSLGERRGLIRSWAFTAEFIRSLLNVLVSEEIRDPEITCQLIALSETQEILEEQIHETLKELGKEEFTEFKWCLRHRNNLEGLKPLPWDALEDADKMKTADLISQAYPQKKVQIVMNILKKIHREDLVSRFQGRPVVGPNRSNVSTIMTTSLDVRSEKVHFGRGQRLDQSKIPSTSA